MQWLLVALASVWLMWLVWVYGSGLRDPRYLDGWLLTAGMSIQLYFHCARKRISLVPRSARRWRNIHIYVGYVLVALFLSHSDFSLPDSAFEWVLWAAFVLVTLSGVFGTYLAWSVQTRRRIDEGLAYEQIPARCADLGRELQVAMAGSNPAAVTIGLPAPPYETWIMELYTDYLRDFFEGPRNFRAHLVGSQRPLRRLTDEIDHVTQFISQGNHEKIATVRRLVVEKDKLDFAYAYLWMTRAWLFVHVPVTYSMVVLTVLHVIVVYAYSSGLW